MGLRGISSVRWSCLRIALAGSALMLTAAPSWAEDARVEVLQRQLAERDKVMLELLRRVETLEKQIGVPRAVRDSAGESKSVTVNQSASAPGSVIVTEQMAERALERSLCPFASTCHCSDEYVEAETYVRKLRFLYDVGAQSALDCRSRVTRWEHEDVFDEVQRRLDEHPERMRQRRETVEHPLGTIKCWMGYTHFQMKTLKHVGTEMALHVLSYNLKRVMKIMGAATLIAAMRAA